MKIVRQLHYVLGVFFAPLIIFFSFSGTLQIFGFHEGAHPAWVATLANIHKDQRLVNPERKRPTESAEPVHTNPDPAPTRLAHSQSSLPLKYFMAAMAVGLIFTTCLGIYMAFLYHQDRRAIWALLALGIILPIAMLFFPH